MKIAHSNIRPGSLLLVAIMLTVSMGAQETMPEDQVMLAYEQRIAGNTDDAKAMLQSVLEHDPALAMANFEMARTIMAENPMNSGDINRYADAALSSDPDNQYYMFFRGRCAFLEAFIAMHKGDNDLVKKHLDEARVYFDNVLNADPECAEAYLFLVDINSAPPDFGGDPSAAEAYANKLTEIDETAAARAELALGQGEISGPEFWSAFIAEHGSSTEALELLFKAHLVESDIDAALELFDQLVEMDPSRNILHLDLARAHIYRVMQGGEDKESDLNAAKGYIQSWLESETSRDVCIEAWSYGLLARIEMFLENQEMSGEYMAKATELCPSFSRAMAVPVPDAPPNSPGYAYASMFSPF